MGEKRPAGGTRRITSDVPARPSDTNSADIEMQESGGDVGKEEADHRRTDHERQNSQDTLPPLPLYNLSTKRK